MRAPKSGPIRLRRAAMHEAPNENSSKLTKQEENPTAPVLGFSCCAFADHPPSTRESGQQNKNPRTESVGCEEINNYRNKITKNIREKIQRGSRARRESKVSGKIGKRARNGSWEPRVIEVHFNGSSKKEAAKRLEEVAAALYEHFCQLVKTDSKVETTVALTPIQRRTGTDG